MATPAPRPSASGGRVRCEKHNSSYNTATSCCALCAAEGTRRPSRREGLPISPLAAAAGLGLVAVLVVGVSKAGRALADRGDAVYTARAATAGKLDPAPFQTPLREVEDLVFSDQPPGFDHGSRIFRAAMSLSEAIRTQAGGNPMLDAKLSEHSQEVLSYGQMMAASEEVGYVAFDLTMAQQEWQDVRDRVFVAADWFASPAPSTQGSGQRPPPTTDPAAVRALRDMALEMENLVRFARSSAMSIDDPSTVRDDWERRRLNDQWQNFRTSIGGRLRSVLQAIPDGSYRLTNDARMAHEHLEAAADAVASLVRAPSPPSRTSRDRYLDQAEGSLERARERLAQL